MKPVSKKRKRGLTLVEVLLALAILGIGLFVLITAASRCLSVARQAKQYEIARRLMARVNLEEPLQLKEEITEDTESGTFGYDYPGYTWNRKIEQALEDDDESGLFKVTTWVSWTDARGVGFEKVVSYLYAPEVVEGGSFESPP